MAKRNKTLSNKNALPVAKLLQEAVTYHQAGNRQKAETLYQSILKKYPNHSDAMHLLGVIAGQAGKNEMAVNLIEKAITINPNIPYYYNNCGKAYWTLHKNDLAISRYEQALAIKPDFVEAHNNLGVALHVLGRTEEAINHYEQALVIKPDYAEAHNNLGNVLQVLGREEEAITRFEQAIAIKPDYAVAHHNLTMIKPKQEQELIIEKHLTSPTVSARDAMHYHYALGNIFEDSKSFTKAFVHYREANTLKRKTIAYDAQHHSGFVDRLITVYSKSYFQDKTVWESDSELPVFIVGMPRSGTTLVEQIISSHPQVYGAGELSSFGRIEDAIANEFATSSPYPACMSDCNDSIALRFSAKYLEELGNYSPAVKRITDKMPDNFLRIGLINTLFPKARIIHCQRNALDTCTSIFLNPFANGYEYSFDLTEIGQYYLDYERLMMHWHSLFSSEIFDVQYEELVMNQESVSRQLIEFLGLEWDKKCLDFHKNKRAVRTASSLQVRKPIYKNSINRWKHYEKHLEPLIAILQHLNKDGSD